MFSIHCANNLLNGSASQSYGKVVQKKNDYAGKEPLKYQINIFVRLLIRPDWKKTRRTLVREETWKELAVLWGIKKTNKWSWIRYSMALVFQPFHCNNVYHWFGLIDWEWSKNNNIAPRELKRNLFHKIKQSTSIKQFQNSLFFQNVT